MNTVYGIFCLASGLLAAYAIRNSLNPIHFQSGRHANLNGLRGFLSLIMFVCHAATWQQYIEDGRWRVSDTPALIIPGQTGIVLFFMITGFLFAKKYLDSKNKEIDWVRVYCSRILRLYPAYLFSMCILLAIITIISVQEKVPTNNFDFMSYVKWALFTVPGAPLLNGIPETNIIMAGVTWSLTFEWAFYFSLPIIAALLGTKLSWPAITFGMAMLATTLYFIPFYGLIYLMIFMGILSAIFDKYTKFQETLNTKIFSLIAITLLFVNGFIHNTTSYTATSIIIISLSFIIFSSGNDVFGLLTKKSTQIFGMGTYSIYLLHGPLLYITFKTIQNKNFEFYKSNEGFWLIAIALAPLLVLLSTFSYVFIEAPAMRHQGKFAKLINKIMHFKFSTKSS